MLPSIRNVLASTPERYILDDYLLRKQASAVYALRRTSKYHTCNAIRVRDDTGTETDVGFSGEGLDTGYLQGWLNRNLVASVPLGVDGNADGVSDGWATVGSATGATTCDTTNGQRFTITNSTAQYQNRGVKRAINGLIEGHMITLRFECWLIAQTNLGQTQLNYRWLNNSDVQIGTWSYSGLYTSPTNGFVTNSRNLTVPAGATKLEIYFLSQDNTVGGGGTVDAWFRNASVTISNQSAYVAKWYDQSGNGLDAVQATAGNQPRIVNAGVLVTDSGRPAIETILANNTHFSVANSEKLQFTQQISFSFVHNPTSLGAGSLGMIVDKQEFAVFCEGTSKLTASTTKSNDGTIVFNETNINTIIRNKTVDVINYYRNGVISGTGTTESITPTSNNMGILNRLTDTARQYDGTISELILFGIALSDAQRQKLERNQSKYYQIGVA